MSKSYEDLAEEFQVFEADKQAEKYFSKYRSQIEDLENTALWKKVRPVNSYDILALGRMLESWDTVKMFHEADNSVADLGVLPRIAHDVITVSFGTSPMAIVASVQSIRSERGIVYFKRIIAGEARGNKLNDELMADARTGISEIPNAYAAAGIRSENWGTGDGSTVAFSGTASNTPLTPRRVVVTATVGGSTITGESNGAGRIVGQGFADTSTINNTTGAYSLTFTTAPDNATTVSADYQVNFEAATNVPVIQTDLQDIDVRAQPYALRTSMGMFKAFKMAQEYGMSASEDEMTQDLVNMLNIEIFGDLIRVADAAKLGNATFAKVGNVGFSAADHRMGFKLQLAEAETNLVGNAGRGTRSFYLGGRTFCEFCSTQPGWNLLYDGSSISGAHLYGTLDGIPVIRIPSDTNVISADKAIIGYKGSQFDAALYFAPYMPLVTTAMLPTTNVLVKQKAVASWSAVGVAVSQFLTGFELT